MDVNNEDIIIVAHKLFAKENPSYGFVVPIFRFDSSGELSATTQENFCPTNRIFITSYYDEIESKFDSNELFRIHVVANTNPSELAGQFASKYVATGRKVDRLRPRDFFEIIEAKLPDPNQRILGDLTSMPGTKLIFVKSEDQMLYGPFEWHTSSVNGEIAISPPTSIFPGPKLEVGQIFKLIPSKLKTGQVVLAANGGQFLTDLTKVFLEAGTYEYFDYSSDHDIISYCSRDAAAFKNQPITKQQLRSLLAQAKVPTAPALLTSRWERFNKISGDLIVQQENVVQLMNEFLSGEAGGGIVATYVNHNESRILADVIKSRSTEIEIQIDALLAKQRAASERLREINEQRADANMSLERLKEEQAKETLKPSVSLVDVGAEVDVALSEKIAELERIKSEIVESSKVVDGINELVALERVRVEVKGDIERIRRDNFELERTQKQLQRECKEEVDEIRKKLIIMKPYVDAINGSFGIDEVPQLPIKVAPAINHNAAFTIDFQKDVLSNIARELKARNRLISSSEVANLIINTQQSFITFLSGLPGAGKTSMCRLIAESQCLGARFNEISVARGWTNLKDLVGFYNPLANRFQPSNTHLYHFLLALDAEAKAGENSSMAYVLLDEANLSPVEHYWSAFVGMTDDGGTRMLSLGQEKIKIPSSLRFLATINYDGTTEPLSQRIVDRSPIIVMESYRPNAEYDVASDVANVNFPLSASEMDGLFGLNPNEVPKFEQDEEKIFNLIRNVLGDPNSEKGRPIIISKRKENAIRQFCWRARGILHVESDRAALDLAVMQHVLPQVRGTGTKFGKRLEELKKIFKERDLVRSDSYLERMLSYGASDLHSYDFFCW